MLIKVDFNSSVGQKLTKFKSITIIGTARIVSEENKRHGSQNT